jgi:hypothetical protein
MRWHRTFCTVVELQASIRIKRIHSGTITKQSIFLPAEANDKADYKKL